MCTHRGGFSLQDLPQDLPRDLPQSEQALLPSAPLPRMLPPSSPGAAGPHTATGLEVMTASFFMRLVVLHADKALAVFLFCIAVAVRGRGGWVAAVLPHTAREAGWQMRGRIIMCPSPRRLCVRPNEGCPATLSLSLTPFCQHHKLA